MALSQSFYVSENTGGTILYLNDDTGTYDASNNTGGYGSPNTERNTLAIIVVAKYKASSGDVTLTATAYDPETVTQITYPASTLHGDGHYRFLIYSAIPKSGTEGSASENDFRYDFSTDTLERYNGSSWVTATNADLETYDYTHLTVNHAHIPNLFKAFNRTNKLLWGTCKSASKNDLKVYRSETDTVRNGGLAYFTEGNYSEFQLMIERYQSKVDTILALT